MDRRDGLGTRRQLELAGVRYRRKAHCAKAQRAGVPPADDATPPPLLQRAVKPFKTFVAKQGELQQKWYVVDAAGKSLGRVSTLIARRLMGKDKATYTPHIDTGDFVVVVN